MDKTELKIISNRPILAMSGWLEFISAMGLPDVDVGWLAGGSLPIVSAAEFPPRPIVGLPLTDKNTAPDGSA